MKSLFVLPLVVLAALSAQAVDGTGGQADLTLQGTLIGSLVAPATNRSDVISVIGAPRGGPGSEAYFVNIGDYSSPGNPGITLNTWINMNAGHEFDALTRMDSACFGLGIDTTYGIVLAGGTWPLAHYANLTEWWPTNALYPDGWCDFKLQSTYNGGSGPTLTLANLHPLNIFPLLNFDMLDTPAGKTTNDVVVRYSVVGVPDCLMFGVSSNAAEGAVGTFYSALRIWADNTVSFDRLRAGSIPASAIAWGDASQVGGLYESPETSLNRGTIIIPHNLGHVPRLVRGVLRCTVTDANSGINSGEEVPFEFCSGGGKLTIVSSPTQFRIQSSINPRKRSTLFFTPQGSPRPVSAVANFKIVIYAFP